jgi:hypothetical protein
LGYIFGQKLQGDEATKLGVLSLVNDTHPAPAKFFDDAVVRNGLPDHWAEILGPERGRVNEGVEVACVIKGQLANIAITPIEKIGVSRSGSVSVNACVCDDHLKLTAYEICRIALSRATARG